MVIALGLEAEVGQSRARAPFACVTKEGWRARREMPIALEYERTTNTFCGKCICVCGAAWVV